MTAPLLAGIAMVLAGIAVGLTAYTFGSLRGQLLMLDLETQLTLVAARLRGIERRIAALESPRQ